VRVSVLILKEEREMTEIAPIRVLIVDHQSEREDIVSMFLRRWGNEVCTVFGGLFPMNEAREFAPDLVLVHADRPEFDALSLVKRFRRRHSFGSIPLIAVSSGGHLASQSAGIAAGFDRWLAKPVPLDVLSGLLADARETISMPAGLAQRTIDNIELFDVLKLEKDNQRRIERLEQP
jgi:DNA-binding response OmpR family regulator